ncbi:hypothetical protein EYB26_006340 [Talaromyces marneffei]|uniref:uncharacterized protein n=1 Tax=Talaromyces marneffei TaxID=37727 RepID=UPI0012A80A84|nr:uncharacterized protein EYB26_006340 [Talaromyces marneffei]QGA18655.1 hypothetical protein EYB26_006340 [Talaromyces marneffei]
MTVLSFTENEPDSLYTIGPVSLDLARWKDSTAGYETHRELIIGHTEAETMPIFAGTAVKHANLHEGDWLFALPLTSVGRKTTGSGGVVKQLMPKYVAAQSLGNSEISGVGTIEEIQSHLRRKTAGDHTPNGKKEMHCRLQHPFPATIQLHPASSVGAALVGMAQWSDPSTIHELKILFEEKNIRVAHKFLASTQSKMVDNVNDAYGRLYEMERLVFGKNSYFAQGSRQHHS